MLADKNAKEKLDKLDFLYLHKIDIYPSYNLAIEEAFKYNPDIALLTLEEPVTLGNRVNPICLPSLSQSDHLYEGETATVAGWGITEDGETSEDELRKVDVPVISNTQCKGFYSWIRRYRFFKP